MSGCRISERGEILSKSRVLQVFLPRDRVNGEVKVSADKIEADGFAVFVLAKMSLPNESADKIEADCFAVFVFAKMSHPHERMNC